MAAATSVDAEGWWPCWRRRASTPRWSPRCSTSATSPGSPARRRPAWSRPTARAELATDGRYELQAAAECPDVAGPVITRSGRRAAGRPRGRTRLAPDRLRGRRADRRGLGGRLPAGRRSLGAARLDGRAELRMVKDDVELDAAARGLRGQRRGPGRRPARGSAPGSPSARWRAGSTTGCGTGRRGPASTRSSPPGRTERCRTTSRPTGRSSRVTWSRWTSAPGSAATTPT